MLDIPENLELVARDWYLQPLAKAPADSPTEAIEQPNLSFPSLRFRGGRDAGWIVKNAKATKIKVDDKMSSSSGGISEISDVKVNGNSLDWYKTFPVEPVAGLSTERDQQRDWKIKAENARRRVLMARPNIEGAKFPPQKNQKGQQDGEYHKRKFFRDAELNPTSSPSGEHGYPSSGPYGSLPSHRSTDTLLDCRLRSTHYTISQDHTSGQEAHEDSLLASFAKRRRTDKPSILLNGSGLLQRSPNLLPSLATGNDAVAQNEGSGMQNISQDGLDFFNNWKPIDSKMPQDALFFSTETVINNTNEGRHRGDEVEAEWVQGRSRRASSYEHELEKYLRRQDRDTSLLVKSGNSPPASLNRQCPRCNRIDSGEWRGGRDVAVTVCDACGLHYEEV